MKKYLSLMTVVVLGFSLVACSSASPNSTTSSSNTSSQTDTPSDLYTATQSEELDKTTLLFNGADVAAAKSIQDYITLTSVYDFETFDQAEADKRLEQVKALKLDWQLAPDEETMFQPLLEALAKERTPGSVSLKQLGILKDTTAEPDPDGLYDATYQVLTTLTTIKNGQVTNESSLVGMVWTKGDKIQASMSIADLQEVVDATEFFNSVNVE